MLFTVYLEAALRDLRSHIPTRPLADANLPLDVEYADDTDFISTSRLFLDDIKRIAPACLAEWSLTINASKTEGRVFAERVDEECHMTRKLGSLLGESRRRRTMKAARECRLPQPVDCVVQANQPTVTAAVIWVLCRACVDIQHGYLGSDKG